MNRKTKEKAVSLVEWVLIASVLVIMFLLIAGMEQKGGESAPGKLCRLDGWYYMEDGQKKEVELPADIRSKEAELVLYNDSLTRKSAGKMVTTRGAQYRLRVTWDDTVLYEYADTAFPRNAQMRSKLDCDAHLPVDLEGGTLALHYAGKAGETFRIAPVFLGGGAAVASYHFQQSLPNLAIVFLMAVMAFASITIALYLFYFKMSDRRFVDVAFFLLFCGIWCATDSSIVQLHSSLAPAVRVVNFYAFMVLSVPMLHFIRNTGEMKRYRSIDVLILLFYANAAAQGLLNYFGVFAFVDMLFVTHILLFAGVTTLGILLMRENHRKRSGEIRAILYAFVTVGASGLLAMLLYWLFEIPFYEVIFEVGILIFVGMLFGSIVTSMTRNIRFRIETLAYQRLALEDGLTGLPNRRAFDEFMREFQTKADTHADAALIFINLHQLRRTNNAFGYTAGNEMVIALAKCIEAAFGAIGKCFRLDGDEFCIVLQEPAFTEEELHERIRQEIDRHNNRNRYKITISWGFSYLRDQDGQLKSFSDWKYQTDQNMCGYAEEKKGL